MIGIFSPSPDNSDLDFELAVLWTLDLLDVIPPGEIPTVAVPLLAAADAVGLISVGKAFCSFGATPMETSAVPSVALSLTVVTAPFPAETNLSFS